MVNDRIEPDKWYVTVNCSYCGEVIPISKVPSPQDEPYLTQAHAAEDGYGR
jgi:hypothetical protein